MKIYKTNDIATAAYLLTKGLKIYHVDIDLTGKYIFEFEDNQGVAFQLSIEFINSECSKFDNQMRNLRNILKSRKNSSKP